MFVDLRMAVCRPDDRRLFSCGRVFDTGVRGDCSEGCPIGMLGGVSITARGACGARAEFGGEGGLGGEVSFNVSGNAGSSSFDVLVGEGGKATSGCAAFGGGVVDTPPCL